MRTKLARTTTVAIVFSIAGFLAACGGDGEPAEDGGAGAEEVVNVYSHRHYESDQRLYQRFTDSTGIEVNVVTGSADELITRLENEGDASLADVLITVDAGRLHRAKSRDLLRPVESEVLRENVPAHLRDRDHQWFGLTRRARVVVYHRERVDSTNLSTYEALAEPEWDDRILIRSSSNVYNQSLLASLVAHLGPDRAAEWAAGVVENMAREPRGGDTDQVEGVAAGVGDVAVVNTYYVARLATSDNADERRVAEEVGVFFPNQDGRGAHVNVSGAGVTRHAPNPENAVRLLEFLTGDAAQRLFAQANHEYPVKPGVEWSEPLRRWGDFRADTLDLTVLGENNAEAVRIFDRAGWR